jgi:hypothetical protein
MIAVVLNLGPIYSVVAFDHQPITLRFGKKTHKPCHCEKNKLPYNLNITFAEKGLPQRDLQGLDNCISREIFSSP